MKSAKHGMFSLKELFTNTTTSCNVSIQVMPRKILLWEISENLFEQLDFDESPSVTCDVMVNQLGKPLLSGHNKHAKSSCAPWCTTQVGDAQFRSVVHKVVLYSLGVAQRRSYKPRQTERPIMHMNGSAKNMTKTGNVVDKKGMICLWHIFKKILILS